MSADPPEFPAARAPVAEPPAPTATADAAESGLSRDAFLGDALLLLQPARGYRAGIDAVLLAASVSAVEGRALRVLDAGAGVGTVGLCVARRLPLTEVRLVERQPLLADLARRNVEANGLGERVSVIEADLLGRAAELQALGVAREAFDVVLANPPYHAEGDGTRSADPIKAGANAMPAEALDDWCRALARACKPGGEAIVIHKADSLAALVGAMQRRFGGLDVLPVHPRAGAPAHRIIVRGIKGSRAPLRLLAGFVLHGHAGHGFTPAAEAILRRGAPMAEWPGSG
jgi:tRNA1(Val) A37 N6-methylase TrmN6